MFRSKRDNPTIAEIVALQNTGIIGTIETRNWLGYAYPDFAKSRRDDVDNAIENYADSFGTFALAEDDEEN